MNDWKPNETVIRKLETFVSYFSHCLDEPLFGTSERSYSPRELLEEVKAGTPYGRMVHQNYLDLGILDQESGSSK